MAVFSSSGSFNNTKRFLQEIQKQNFLNVLKNRGMEGIGALEAATPKDSGITSTSWGFQVVSEGSEARIEFTNSNVNKGVPIAIILQYGHGTGTGGYVAGRDYINPAIQPVFDKILDDIWGEVKSL